MAYFCKSLPNPLSKEEELEFLARLHEGDMEARDVLIERNLRLVVHIVNKNRTADIDFDDLISIGNIGLIKGIDTFNLSKGKCLSTYLTRCIENEILMYFRKIKKRSNEKSLEEPICTDSEGNELLICDVFGGEDEGITNIINKIDFVELYKCLRRLTPMQERVIRLRYGITSLGQDSDGATQKEVAEKLSISQSYVSTSEKKALRKLRTYIKS